MSLRAWWRGAAAESPRIVFRFDEAKATAAAVRLLELAGGEMNYLKLIKLLYFADRESLDRFGRPITGDRFVSMKHGPVLSRVYNLIKGTVNGRPEPGLWGDRIQCSSRYDLAQRAPADVGALSYAELEIIEAVYRAYGDHEKWELRDVMHGLAEWEDPGESSSEILPETILRVLGKSQAEIDAVRRAATESAYFDSIFSRK